MIRLILSSLLLAAVAACSTTSPVSTSPADAPLIERARFFGNPSKVAARISPDGRMAVVGTPGYFAKHPKPKTPRDLPAHNCINIRLPTAGGLYAWEFKKAGRELNVRVEGQLVFNTATLAVKAALAGIGLAFVPEQRVQSYLESGELLRVLPDWCPAFSGFHLYYPSRRQPTPAFVVVANALRLGA